MLSTYAPCAVPLPRWSCCVSNATFNSSSADVFITCCLVSKFQCCLNSLRPRQNGRHFADYIFKRIFLNENVWIPIKISMKFVPKGPITNIPALVKIMAWRRPGDKPLYEPMMVSLLTHICVTLPQWVNSSSHTQNIGSFENLILSCISWPKYFTVIEISFRLVFESLIDVKWALVQVMAWWHQATNYCQNQWWPVISTSHYLKQWWRLLASSHNLKYW